MVRISKQSERRMRSPRKHQKSSVKTGPKREAMTLGFKPHANALEGAHAALGFIPKIK